MIKKIIKKIKNTISTPSPIYLSNSDKQNLEYHLKAVSRVAVEKAKLLGLEDKSILELVKMAALLHDIGKAVSSFQGYLNGSFTETSPHHNEIGWAILRESGQFDSKILNAVYWHHARPLNDKFEYLENVGSILNKLSDSDIDAVLDICKQVGVKISKTKNNYDVGVPSLYIEDGTGNNDDNSIQIIIRGCLIASDRTLSRLTPKQIEEIAEGSSLDSYEELKDKSFSSLTHDLVTVPESYDLIRFNKQKECLDLCIKNKTTLVKAPSGFGKTFLGVMFSMKSGRKTFWVCPRNVVAETVFKNIMQELSIMKLEKTPSVELFLTGERKSQTDNAPVEPFTSDIVVTNIDNLLKPTVSNDVADRLFMCLYSNIVFDEFHEFVGDSPMFSMFIYMMRLRHRLASVPKTLLMSATPTNMECLWDTIKYKTLLLPNADNHYPAAHTKPYQITVTKTPPLKIVGGGLLVQNSIKNSQSNSMIYKADILLHSKYTDEDRALIMAEIHKNFDKGGKGIVEGIKVCSAPVIQASLDISFSWLCETILSPEATLQRIGRVNRWGEQSVGRDLILLESSPKDKSEDGAIKTLYDVTLMNYWVDFLNKEIPVTKSITLDEIYLMYNKFYKDHRKLLIGYLMSSHKKGSEELADKCYPIKVPHLVKKSSNKSLRTPDGSFYYTVRDANTGSWLDTPFSCSYFDVSDMLKANIDRTTSSWVNVLKGMVASGYLSYKRLLTNLNKGRGVFTDKKITFICRNKETPYPDGSRKYHRKGTGKTFIDIGRGIE